MRPIRLAAASFALIASTAGAQTFAGHAMQLNGDGGNGSPLVTAGGSLQLMNDLYGSQTSAWTTQLYSFSPATAWSTTFTLRYAFTTGGGFNAGGDGIAFALMSGPATTLAIGGGSMGYEGISNSIGVGFRSFWDDVLIGENGTFTQAALTPPAGLNIAPADDFTIDVSLAYDGANNLSIGYTTSRGFAFAPASYVIDPSSLGPQVRLGFTAGSGAATQLAEVTAWQFSGLSPVTATPEPATLSLMALGIAGMVVVRRKRSA